MGGGNGVCTGHCGHPGLEGVVREKGWRAGKTRAGRCPERESTAASQCAGGSEDKRHVEMEGDGGRVECWAQSWQDSSISFLPLPGPSAEPRPAEHTLRTALPRDLIAKNF